MTAGLGPRRVAGCAALLALGLVLVLAGCGSSSPRPSSPVPTSRPTNIPSGGPGTTPAPPGPSTLAPRETLEPSPDHASTPTAEPSFDPAAVRVSLRQVAAGLENPLLVTGARDGTGRLLVLEQAGRIRLIERGRLAAGPLLDISDRIEAGGERGLLGLALAPDFATSGRLYVNYTDLAGDTVVSEFTAQPGSLAVGPATERVLLQVDQPFANHNGGGLAFGPDGFLYIALGDGGSRGDPQGNGQRLDTFLAKILRIDVAPGADRPYSIPADNPFVERAAARAEIWLYGLRNPWRFGFDRASGLLWIGDVGQGRWEEIDRVGPAEAGANLGWNVMEGAHCYEPASDCPTDGLTLPITEYDHGDGCSVTGGHVYRGEALSVLIGGYMFGDYCSGNIWVIDAAAVAPVAPTLVLQTRLRISSFGEDDRGEIYLTDLAGGGLYEVVARP